MTDKQKRFCDEYIIDLNPARAYKATYRHVKSYNVAKSAGNRLLTNVDIRAYIDERLDKISSEKIATAEEVLQELTAILRRECSEVMIVIQKEKETHIDENGHKVTSEKEIPVRVEIPTRIADVNKAAELLGKYYGLFIGKYQIETVVPVFGGEEDLED